jgi:hypothetical protein
MARGAKNTGAGATLVRIEQIDAEDRIAINALTPAERKTILVEAGLEKIATATAARPTIRVERTYSAYGGRVPEAAWEHYGVARTWRGLERMYRRIDRMIHPQQNAWSGHMRFLTAAGEPIEYRNALKLLGHPDPDGDGC